MIQLSSPTWRIASQAAFGRATRHAILALFALAALATPAAARPLTANWNGLYIGGHGGVDWADTSSAVLGNFEYVSGLGGGHLGYNFGLGRFIAGFEADASWAGSDASFTTPAGEFEISTGWHGTVRGRFGIGLGTMMAYVTAGYAWSETTLTQTTAAGTRTTSQTGFDGVVYGAGAESFMWPSISLRVEALRYDYSASELSWSAGAGALGDLDLADTVLRAGVTWHLN